MKITVFTPTYNRGYILNKLFESLQTQTFKDFEWIIIDDGSNDNTEEIVNGFIDAHHTFDIFYYKQQNGGKHRAINEGVKRARGNLFYIVDSDDYLPNDALEIIIMYEESISQDEKKCFAGVCGLRVNKDNKINGTTFSGAYIDITSLQRDSYGISGDKAEVFYTEILRKYPFPVFEGENFVTECVVWDKIAFDGYKLRYFNVPVYICDYLDDGLTFNYNDIYRKNPKSYGLYIHQSIVFGKLKDNRKKSEVIRYLQCHGEDYSYMQLGGYLHMKIYELLPYIVEMYDLRHLPNRIGIKLLGQKKYNQLKNRMKK